MSGTIGGLTTDDLTGLLTLGLLVVVGTTFSYIRGRRDRNGKQSQTTASD